MEGQLHSATFRLTEGIYLADYMTCYHQITRHDTEVSPVDRTQIPVLHLTVLLHSKHSSLSGHVALQVVRTNASVLW